MVMKSANSVIRKSDFHNAIPADELMLVDYYELFASIKTNNFQLCQILLSDKPLRLSRSLKKQAMTVDLVVIGHKDNSEIKFGSGIADSTADCWFVVFIRYHSSREGEIVVSNGKKFYLCRRQEGNCRFIFNRRMKDMVLKHMKNFVRKDQINASK